jgi:hypothetical protein
MPPCFIFYERQSSIKNKKVKEKTCISTNVLNNWIKIKLTIKNSEIEINKVFMLLVSASLEPVKSQPPVHFLSILLQIVG